jgi:ketosteroid isomerase-like protein
MKTPSADIRARRVVEFFESLRVEDLARLGELYAHDAFFKDPFNEVRGLAPIEAIFAHMFRSLDGPRFVVHDAVVQGDQCFLSWDFVFRLRRSGGEALTVRGASHLRFGSDGRITSHRDYWDAAEELYEKLPLLGALMRWLKRRVNA